MARCNYRCSKCETRHVFKFAPDSYSRPKKCRHCGSETFRVDGWMNARDTKKMSCDCAGYIHLTSRVFPHRQGSKYCWFRQDGTQRMQDDIDFHDSRLEELQAV